MYTSTSRLLIPLVLTAVLSAACGSSGSSADDADPTSGDPSSPIASSSPSEGSTEAPETEGESLAGVKLTLMTHDSFAVSEGTLEAFTAETGHEVVLLQAGDAGELVNRSVLTAGNPEADVMFGVDNTFLSAALAGGVFEGRSETAVDAFGDALPDGIPLDPGGRVVPVDFGDVCLNYDRSWFADAGIEPPSELGDLADPALAGLTVVQDPSTSSPGLAFLMATVAEFGADGWETFWSDLVENDVMVTAGWEDAYYGAFTHGSGGEGDRPIVVSYASSPPAEVIFGDYDVPPEQAPTGVVADACFRQVEYAGVLAGTDHPEAAGQLVDFMLSDTFQSDVALNMFVFPARGDIELPREFVDYAEVIENPLVLSSEEIEANRSDWIDAWDEVMAG